MRIVEPLLSVFGLQAWRMPLMSWVQSRARSEPRIKSDPRAHSEPRTQPDPRGQPLPRLTVRSAGHAEQSHAEQRKADQAQRETSPQHVGQAWVGERRETEFWRGRSGRAYRHVVHDLIRCPAPVRGVYVLARRDATGRAQPIFTGVAASTAPTLNLAHIRRRAVSLSASEVHLFEVPHAASPLGLRRIVRDLRAAFGDR
jgi:hypothetical protein